MLVRIWWNYASNLLNFIYNFIQNFEQLSWNFLLPFISFIFAMLFAFFLCCFFFFRASQVSVQYVAEHGNNSEIVQTMDLAVTTLLHLHQDIASSEEELREFGNDLPKSTQARVALAKQGIGFFLGLLCRTAARPLCLDEDRHYRALTQSQKDEVNAMSAQHCVQ